VAIDTAAVSGALLCEVVVVSSTRSPPFRTHGRDYELTTESCLELVGMLALRQTENRHVDIVLTIRIAAPAEREAFCLAEDVDRQVLVAHAAIRRECYLVPPVSIHHRFAELLEL